MADPSMVAEMLINPSDPSAYRHGDASLKGPGFLGPLKNTQGGVMSEYSIGMPVNGQQMEIPSMVPTLSAAEIAHLLKGGDMTDQIADKARNHAMARMSRNLPVFAGYNEPIMPYPQPDLGK